MFISVEWLVLFLFIILFVVAIVVYEINSKFKWKATAFKYEEEVNKLKFSVNTESLKSEFNEVINDIRSNLTSRQFEIFMLAIEGLSSKEIGDKLNISPTTIDSHIKDIIKNLNVKKRSQLANIFFDRLKQTFNTNSLADL